MIVAAAVCPEAPLLLPGLAPGLAAAARDLVDACARAAATSQGAEKIPLLTGAAEARSDAARRPGMSVVVGEAKLVAAVISHPVETVEPYACGSLDCVHNKLTSVHDGLTIRRGAVGGQAETVGVMAFAEGSGSRGHELPGGGDDGAEPSDARLAAALVVRHPDALAAGVAAGRSRASQMGRSCAPTWCGLGLMCADLPPTRAALLYSGAPFGVGYPASTWGWS